MDRIGRLPFQMRHMVNEIALGAEYSDVAAEMGLAEGTVKSRLNRVRAHLTEVTT
jgi:DNA-directed RNA polymerase specialized sigma24 family protein